MTITIDLNADLGEMDTPQGRAAERDILRYVSSCNIACGAHAGSPKIMAQMAGQARAQGVTIGAHPSYPDRENFGRKSLKLGSDIRAQDLINSVTEQIVTLTEIAAGQGAAVKYVKPHGTLYTDAAKDPVLADLITGCVYRLDPGLAFMGAPGSHLEASAKALGLRFIGEGFIDRRYANSGHLVPRSEPGAVISAQSERVSQMRSLVFEKAVTAKNGETVRVDARSLCLHGDSSGAVETARKVRAQLEAEGVTIQSFIANG